MRRILLVAVVLVGGLAAVGSRSAAASAYPPTDRLVTVDPAVGPPGFSARVEATCAPGETVSVELRAGAAREVCSVDGSVVVEIGAPGDPGVHEGQVVGVQSGRIGAFAVTVEAGASETETETGRLNSIVDPQGEQNWSLRIALIVVFAALVVAGAIAQRRRAWPGRDLLWPRSGHEPGVGGAGT